MAVFLMLLFGLPAAYLASRLVVAIISRWEAWREKRWPSPATTDPLGE